MSGRSVGDDAARIEQHEPREEVGREAQIVEHGEDRGAIALVEVDEQLHRTDLVAQVEVDRRFVEHQQRRRLGDGQRDQHQLALAERQLTHVPPEEMSNADPLDGCRDRRAVRGTRPTEGVLVRQSPEPDDFLEIGDHVVVLARYLGRGRGSGVEIHQEGAHVFELRDGMVMRLEIFATRARALEYVRAAEAARGT